MEKSVDRVETRFSLRYPCLGLHRSPNLRHQLGSLRSPPIRRLQDTFLQERRSNETARTSSFAHVAALQMAELVPQMGVVHAWGRCTQLELSTGQRFRSAEHK